MKKIILGITLLLAFNVNAVTIEYDETTSARLDTEFQVSGINTHVDMREGGLEWLDFGDYSGNDVTFGHSVNRAAGTYAKDGFRLATETEVTDLFSFFYSSFVGDGNGLMTGIAESETNELINERNSWLLAFGTDKIIADGTIGGGDSLYSLGMYLADDLTIQMAGFMITVDPKTETTLISADYNVDFLDANIGYSNYGVFMVRDYIPAVPIPAAVWLFGTGLLGLIAIARRRT